jgi:VWFA-related protein
VSSALSQSTPPARASRSTVLSALFVLALEGPLVVAQPAVAQPATAEVADRIDVTVLEVNVVVTDRHGIPATDLSRDEFRLVVNDRPVAIEYFSAFANGIDAVSPAARARETEDAAAGATRPEPVAPVLAILWDAGSLAPQDGKQVLAGIDAEVDALLAATRGIMVAEYSERLSTVQPLTRSPELVRAAIDSLTGSLRSVTARADQRMLFRQIEVASSGSEPGQGGFDLDEARETAKSILFQITNKAVRDRNDFARRMAGLAELVDSLGAIEGRKELLYLGAGLELQPGGLELRVFEQKYQRAFPELVSQLKRELLDAQSVGELRQLTARAARQQVVFHTVLAGGPSWGGRSAESQTSEVDTARADQGIRQGELLSTLASATGGEVNLGRAKPKALLDRVRSGLANYYTLGFTVPDDAPPSMKVRVEVTRPKLEMRYWRNISRDVDTSLERVASGALIATTLDNPLRARVDRLETTPITKEQRQGSAELKGATAIVGFLIRVPVAELVLLPEGNLHRARLTFAVAARGPRGASSTPTRREASFEIANDRLLQAMTQDVAVPIQLAIAEGEHEIVVVVQDSVGERTSTLRLTSGRGEG